MPKVAPLAAFVVLALLAVFSAFAARAAPSKLEGEPVVVDLRDWMLDVEGRPDTPVHFPTHLDAERLTTSKGTRAERYILRTTFDVPAAMRARELTFAVTQLPTLAALKVNGRFAVPHDTGELAVYRTPGPQRWRVPVDMSDTDGLTLELIVENTWTQSAWLDAAPRLSATTTGDARFLIVRGWNQVTAIAALATTLIASLSYLIVFVADRSRRAYGWYALEAFCGGAYPAFGLGLLQWLVGGEDLLVMGVMLGLSAVAAVHVAHAQFKLGAPSVFWKLAWLAVSIGVVVVRNPFRQTQLAGPAVVALVAICSYYLVFTFVRVGRRSRADRIAWLFAAAWATIAIGAVVDGLAWMGLGELLFGVRFGYFAIAVISLVQSVVLSLEHISSLTRADRLNVELAARVAAVESKNLEVQSLNAELKRQIAARSEQLSQTLARVGDLRTSTEALGEGAVIDERYRVVRPLGSGGMGEVYEVERIADRARFAMKVVQRTTSGVTLARFAREAQIVAQLDHPNVIGIVDVDLSANGQLFLVMELITGTSLEDERPRFGDVAWALPILQQLADGLTAIHAAGVVHRDLKPANVLLATSQTGAPVVKIADFGIAALGADASDAHAALDANRALATTANADASATMQLGDPKASLTQTGVILGTPLYMAPELVCGTKNATAAADMFGFGCVAYELLARKLPFAEPALLAAMHGRTLETPEPLDAPVPRALAAVLARCVAIEPTERPASADVARALREALASAA